MAAKNKLSLLNVNRGEMATALDRAFTKFGKATEDEIDARVKAAFEAHNRARHRSLRQRWTDFLVRARG
jgi:hypothetical protein